MIKLPELLKNTQVSITSIPMELDRLPKQGVLWQAAYSSFLLTVPKVARYLVLSGKTVVIETVPETLPSEMEYHFAMLPLAALIYQHGFLALHASVATNEKGAILIAGDSGAGKSTLLTALNQLGWQVMADDLALVGLNKLGQPIVYPSKFGIALWPDSFKKLGIAPTTLLHSDANRREFIPSGQFTNTPKLLCKIYCLGVHNRKNVVCSEVKPIARFCMINTILYNSHVADVLCDRSEYLRSVAAISRSVPIVNMLRPRGTWSVELLAEVISNPD